MLPLRHSVRMSVSSEDNISLANILLGAKNAPNFGPKSNFASWERHCALQFWDQESTVASFSFPFRSFSFPSTHSYGLAGGPGTKNPLLHPFPFLFLSFYTFLRFSWGPGTKNPLLHPFPFLQFWDQESTVASFSFPFPFLLHIPTF